MRFISSLCLWCSTHLFPVGTSSLSPSLESNTMRLAEKLMDGSSTIRIVGFGSLLSETSARSTFPELENFRYARVEGFRRIFTHPAPIFFERGIAKSETKEFSSLSVQPAHGHGFICSVFDITGEKTVRNFIAREIEYDFAVVPFKDFDGKVIGKGVMCVRSSDEEFIQRYGEEEFQNSYGKWGIDTIWGWGPTSGILPCPVYLRHCVLAAQKQADFIRDSFLDETYLADCRTTIREYLEARPDIMETLPPKSLIGRYSG